MTKLNLSDELDKLATKEDFSKFVFGMLDDFRSDSANWENQDLPSFLEAIAAWSKDMDGFYANQGRAIPKDINWKVFAEILYAARVYE
ncbi:MAG: hypothetical protein RL497_3142 [Pseudomonadota bacterium]